MKPFMRWVGGKSQMLKHIKPLVPQFDGKYIEPFIGGGAMYLNLNYNDCIINDLNSDVAAIYALLNNDGTALMDAISDSKYKNDKESFFIHRKRFNELKASNELSFERTVLFLYLNYTCYNGLYRENKKGLFSNSYGIRPSDMIHWPGKAVEKLANVKTYMSNHKTIVMNGDYSNCLAMAKVGDFVYIDPPYLLDKTFTYTAQPFEYKEQDELIQWCDKLDKLGCKIMYSNSITDYVKNKFIALGPQWNIKELHSTSSISCKVGARVKKGLIELLVMNY